MILDKVQVDDINIRLNKDFARTLIFIDGINAISSVPYGVLRLTSGEYKLAYYKYGLPTLATGEDDD